MSGNSVLSLSERLAQKMEEDRRRIEETMRSELDVLVRNWKQQSSDVLRTTLDDMASDLRLLIRTQIEPMSQALANLRTEAQALNTLTIKAWMKPLLVSLSILLGVAMGSWGLAKWLSISITDRLQTLTSLQRQIERQQQTLASLQRQIEQQKQALLPGTGTPGQRPARRP